MSQILFYNCWLPIPFSELRPGIIRIWSPAGKCVFEQPAPSGPARPMTGVYFCRSVCAGVVFANGASSSGRLVCTTEFLSITYWNLASAGVTLHKQVCMGCVLVVMHADHRKPR